MRTHDEVKPVPRAARVKRSVDHQRGWLRADGCIPWPNIERAWGQRGIICRAPCMERVKVEACSLRRKVNQAVSFLEAGKRGPPCEPMTKVKQHLGPRGRMGRSLDPRGNRRYGRTPLTTANAAGYVNTTSARTWHAKPISPVLAYNSLKT